MVPFPGPDSPPRGLNIQEPARDRNPSAAKGRLRVRAGPGSMEAYVQNPAILCIDQKLDGAATEIPRPDLVVIVLQNDSGDAVIVLPVKRPDDVTGRQGTGLIMPVPVAGSISVTVSISGAVSISIAAFVLLQMTGVAMLRALHDDDGSCVR